MGFSAAIQHKILNDTARHCCVCHRYKGVKIEIHHLVQEAHGGPNTFENAIPLCFDCHSDAGHYNVNHPKGTKFSISELRKARDNWFNFVRKNPLVKKLIISDSINASYYVLHSFDILDSVMNGNFTSFIKNRNRIYLSQNNIYKNWKLLLKSHKNEFGHKIEQQLLIEVGHFNSIDEYCNTYEGVKVTDKSSDEYPYFEVIRKSNWDEILSIIEHNSFIKQLSNSGIDAEDFCTAVLYKNGEGCDGGNPNFEYSEFLEFAPISFVFLGITNTSKGQIKLNKLKTYNKKEVVLPHFNLQPSEMVLLPIGSAINLQEIDKESVALERQVGERVHDFSRVISVGQFDAEKVIFLKDQINPKSLNYNDNSGEYQVEIHKLDFNNLYSLNSYWLCGSCPHLFLIKKNGQQKYARELLVASSNKNGSDEFLVPEGIHEIVIRELEDEITFIDKVLINNKSTIHSIVLKKGDSVSILVKPNDLVTIIGRYVPIHASFPKLNDLWKRNEIIKESNKIINLTLI